MSRSLLLILFLLPTSSASAVTFEEYVGQCEICAGTLILGDAEWSQDSAFIAYSSGWVYPPFYFLEGTSLTIGRAPGSSLIPPIFDYSSVPTEDPVGRHYFDDPSLSPDASRIAFTEHGGLYLLAQGDSMPVFFPQLVAPLWSPRDSQQILVRKIPDWLTIRLLDLSTMQTNPLTAGGSPAWAPDGDGFLYQPSEQEAFYHWRKNQENELVLPASLHARAPSWSPDAQWLVYHSKRDGDSNLYIYSRQQQAEYPLTQGPEVDAFPKWSPDGQRILFRRNGDLWLASDLHTVAVRRLSWQELKAKFRTRH